MAHDALMGSHDMPVFRPLDLVRPAYWQPRLNALDLGEEQARTFFAALWPREAHTDFLRPFFQASGGHRLSLWVEPIPTEKVMHDLNIELRRLQTTAFHAERQGRMADAYTTLAYQDAVALRDALAAQTTKMFHVSLLITLLAEGAGPQARDALEQASLDLRREAQATLWTLRSAWLEQGAAFLSTLPLALPKVTRPKLLDSASLACTFTLTSADVMDPGGVAFAQNLLTGKPILLNLADTTRYPAPHMVVMAPTRSGKSLMIKYYLVQRRMLDPDVHVLVLDPSKPIDYQHISEKMGTYVRLRAGSGQRINPCEIAYPANLAEMDPEDRLLLTQKVDYLRTLLYLMAYPDQPKGTWGQEVRPYINQVIRGVYEAYGISDDPLSLIDPATLDDPVPRLKPMPTLGDIQAAFQAHPVPAVARVATLFEDWITGPMNLFNGHTRIRAHGGVPDVPPLEQPWVTFNIEGLIENHPDRQHVVHFIVGEMMAQRMVQSRRKKIIVLDEAHLLFSQPDTALWASRLYRMAGKANTQVILITQSLGDLIGVPGQNPVLGQEYARICLQQSYVQILMRQGSKNELNLLQNEFSLDDSLVGWLEHHAKQGDALILGQGQQRFRALGHVNPPPSLLAWIGSNPDELPDRDEPYTDPLGGRVPRPAGGEASEPREQVPQSREQAPQKRGQAPQKRGQEVMSS